MHILAASPKFVRDGKKYGRRTRPENQGSETPLDFAELSDMEMDYSYTSPVNTPNPGKNSLSMIWKHNTCIIILFVYFY